MLGRGLGGDVVLLAAAAAAPLLDGPLEGLLLRRLVEEERRAAAVVAPEGVAPAGAAPVEEGPRRAVASVDRQGAAGDARLREGLDGRPVLLLALLRGPRLRLGLT